MLPIERKRMILAYVTERHIATVSELANEFNVHEATIRRDLSALENEGALYRTHGGVTIGDQEVQSEPPFIEREKTFYKEKERIGKYAASLIHDGDNVILDSGTTTLHIARELTTKKDVTVVTNDINIAATLRNHKHIKVIVTGGVIEPESYMLNGSLTDNALQTMNVHKAFIGTPAIHVNKGITHFDDNLVPAKKGMIEAAKVVIAVADHTKFGRISLHKVVDIKDVDMLITDTGLSESELDLWREIHMNMELV
ncbi:DeoR/GlpR transcriptional regulator [Bacillaceae bacterium SIJ1]|uniref:DeoR/GlpR family DNA-binding transcription regulator n=1 Tax=Litoribacterium kuwaitense TaxID=1398745 RepID=UPI0013EBA9B6|nr:DeoR/GlpR family DNA-binding transcription regulator [Litoribacterium kuwaitense]NGP45740.1 DeoR/GlpR transcriptional regulator [Litoribacterium kuwaitense]